MKRFLAVLFALLMVFSLCACAKNDNNTDQANDTKTTSTESKGDGTSVIVKKDIPDPDLIGVWKAESEEAPYIIFTDTSKVRIVRGAHTLESEISYGEDGLGNKSIATDCSEFKGQSVYTVVNDILTITYPVLSENGEVIGFEDLIFKAATDYEPLTILPEEGFAADEALVGIWTNELTGEEYEFTKDGFLLMKTENFNGNVETYIVESTYTVDDGNVTVYSISDRNDNKTETTIDYYIEGTKLLLGGADYYLNGEGDPNAVAAE